MKKKLSLFVFVLLFAFMTTGCKFDTGTLIVKIDRDVYVTKVYAINTKSNQTETYSVSLSNGDTWSQDLIEDKYDIALRVEINGEEKTYGTSGVEISDGDNVTVKFSECRPVILYSW